jgi:fumarate reductase iron-sulfur subunit
MPMPVFKLIGDLSVDTGTWFRGMNEKVQSWIHTAKTFQPGEVEEPMDNALAEQIYELERCIECGCCVAACGKANMVPENFMGATAFNRITRFMIDPRDERKNDEYFAVVGNEDGIFGCLGLLGCEDTCPKKIPLQDQLGMLRRKMGFSQVKHLFRALLPGHVTN